MIRLDKVLAHLGYGSRKEVKEMIKKENKTTITPEEIIIYPQYAMRGTVSNEKETKDVEIKSE